MVDNINAGLQLFTNVSRILASSLDIFFSEYNVLTVLEPMGYPHKNPIITAVALFLETLKSFDMAFPNILESILIISVLSIISVKNINGKSEGSTDDINMVTLFFTDSKFSFDKNSKINSDIKNNVSFNIVFNLYTRMNFICIPNKFYE